MDRCSQPSDLQKQFAAIHLRVRFMNFGELPFIACIEVCKPLSIAVKKWEDTGCKFLLLNCCQTRQYHQGVRGSETVTQ